MPLPSSATTLRPRAAVLLGAGVLAAALAAPTAADAQGFTCEASAVRGIVLGGQAIEPVVANRGATACVSRNAGGVVPLPALLSAQAASASTLTSGAPGPGQRVLAAGGLADVRVLALPELPIRLPTPEIADLTVPVTGQLQTLLAQLVPGLGNSLSLDLGPALEGLLPDGRLPTAELLRVQSVMAYAGASCQNGRPALTGTSRVAGVSVLGLQLPLNGVLEQALSLGDTTSIDPSDLDIAKLPLPAGALDGLLGTLLRPAIQTALDALPPISIPAAVAQVKVTPGAEARTADSLVRQALRVQISVLGQSLADLVVGEAKVGSARANCAPDAAAAAADLILGCTKRRLVLTDVQERDGRVRLLGVADRALIGRRVSIRFPHTGRTVARATVRPDGSFTARAKPPARSLRGTNRARYQAVVGRERSLSLKLRRRMILSGTRVAGGRVTLSGRVTRPMASPARSITVTQRVSCRRSKVVARVKPSRSGRFRVRLAVPDGQLAAVYRLSTRVRKTTRNRKTFPTFTLPRSIALR